MGCFSCLRPRVIEEDEELETAESGQDSRGKHQNGKISF